MNYMRIYLFGWFGFKNIGDDLLLAGMLDFFSRYEVQSLEVAVRESGYLETLFSQYAIARPVKRNYVDMFRAAFRCDCLVIGPGGLFPQDNLPKVIVFLLLTFIWRLLRRRVVFFCVGGNSRQRPLSALIWRLIASMSNLFISRDENLLQGASIAQKPNVFSAADAVFGIAGTLNTTISLRRDNACHGIALALANLFDFDGGPDYEAFVESCSLIVRHAQRRGYEVTLLTFTAKSDGQLNADIETRVPSVRVLGYEDTLAELKNLSKYTLVVGMRFHSVVLSLLQGVPVIPVAYADKTKRLALSCGLSSMLTLFCRSASEYFQRPIPLDSKDICNKIDCLLSNRNAGIVNNSVIQGYVDRAHWAFEKLAEIIET